MKKGNKHRLVDVLGMHCSDTMGEIWRGLRVLGVTRATAYKVKWSYGKIQTDEFTFAYRVKNREPLAHAIDQRNFKNFALGPQSLEEVPNHGVASDGAGAIMRRPLRIAFVPRRAKTSTAMRN